MDEITVIVSTSPVQSNPEIKMITSVIRSVSEKLFNGLTFKLIIACDGIKELETNIIKISYQEFIKNLKDYYQNDPLIQIIICPYHGHLTGNLRNACKYVDTEFILVLQHDLIFVQEINLSKVIQDMKIYPVMKHLRFNKRFNIKDGWDRTKKFAKDIIVSTTENTYISTEAWSDQNHLCRLSYYQEIILQEVPDGCFMESILNQTCKGHHSKYGTYIYGNINFPNTILHLDGAETRRSKIYQQNRNLFTENHQIKEPKCI